MALSILIAEDNLTSRVFLSRLLQEWGACDIAVNGREAVELVHHHLLEGSRYDLICLDIVMPEMNGIESLKEIRRLEEKHNVLHGSKILMITKMDESDTIRESFRDQCDGYLIKPYSRDKLRTKLAELGFEPALKGA